MARSKRVIPDFMIDNPDDSFMFLMPLNLKPDLAEDMGNSYFNVAVKNLTKNEYFEAPMAPELFFTHFKLQTAYKNGKLDRQSKKKNQPDKQTLTLDTRLTPEEYDVALDTALPQEFVGRLLDWTYKHFLDEAKKIRCCIISLGVIDVVIPHYVIAVYYYYRSTILRETTLRSDLENLPYGIDCNPSDASIIVPNYVPEDDTPFIHRFLCQKDAIEAFQSMGTYLNAYLKREKEKYRYRKPEELYRGINHVPIKAKFPYRGEFSITCRLSSFFDKEKGKHYFFVHEITDDDSPIGFSKFTTFFQGKRIVTDVDDIDSLPTIPVKNPSDTSRRLQSVHASRRYKHNSITVKRKKKCGSLAGVDMATNKITDEEALERLKILEETLTDENVDQSLTDSSGNKEKEIRKARVSAKGKEFITTSITESTKNFDEFRQYVEHMYTKKDTIVDLKEHASVKMKTVMNGINGTANPKCIIQGGERQYITATFRYKNAYVGLLELENSGPTSTWVISSKEPFGAEMFDRFLKHYVEDDMAINDIKKKYGKNSNIKFRTKNHERTVKLETTDKIRWVAGVLGKIVI